MPRLNTTTGAPPTIYENPEPRPSSTKPGRSAEAKGTAPTDFINLIRSAKSKEELQVVRDLLKLQTEIVIAQLDSAKSEFSQMRKQAEAGIVLGSEVQAIELKVRELELLLASYKTVAALGNEKSKP